MHHYLVKFIMILAVVVCLNRILRVRFSLPFPRRAISRSVWLLAAIELFETDGWTLIPAVILAVVWQMAERR